MKKLLFTLLILVGSNSYAIYSTTESYYDAEGYRRSPGDSFYDAEGYRRNRGDSFYDGEGFRRKG